MTVVHPNAAGIDIGSKFHVAAVDNSKFKEPVRTFQSFTTDLHEMAKWFRDCGFTSIAMESTGIYWIPAFEILEDYSFEVFLVNAREQKTFLGAKRMLMMRNGFSAYINMACYALALDLKKILQYCVPI